MATAIGDLVASLRMDTRGFQKGSRGAMGSMRAISGAAGALTSSLLGAGGLAFAFTRMGRSANEFAGAMNRSVAIMTGVNAKIRKDMERTAISVAFNTKFAAREAADAYFFLASAGLDAAQSMAALPGVAKFAQAGNFDLALATDLATDALSALGLKVKDAATNAKNLQFVMDSLVKANTLANASVEQFSKSLTTKAGAAMKLYGIELKNGLALLAAWADQGVKGEDSGTRFDIVIRDLTSKALLNAEAFEKLGIAVFEFGKLRNPIAIVEDMERAMGKMTDRGKKAALMQLGFTIKTVSATASLLGASAAMREWSDSLDDVTGTTNKVADNQTNLDKSMAKFGATMQQVSNDFFPPLLDSFSELITDLSATEEGFDKSGKAMSIWAKAGKRSSETFDAFRVLARGPGVLGALIGRASAGERARRGEANRLVEQVLFNLPELVEPVSPDVLRRRREGREAVEAARPRTLKDFVGPDVLDFFGKAGKAAGFGLDEAFGVSAVDEALPALRTEFQGLLQDAQALSRLDAFSDTFDLAGTTEELAKMDKQIQALMELPQRQAMADLFGFGQQTVGGVGVEGAIGILPGLKENFANLQSEFVTANEAAMEKVRKLGVQMFDETRTPMEQFQQRLRDIDDLFELSQLGPDPITAETAERARKAAAETLRQATGEKPPSDIGGRRFAGAMERGSAEALSTIVNAGRGSEKIAKQQLTIAKQQLAETKKNGRKLDGQTVSIPVG